MESLLRDESNDSDVTLEEYLDATVSEEELKCTGTGSEGVLSAALLILSYSNRNEVSGYRMSRLYNFRS